jgi:putative glutamine amidotransferase
MLHPLIGLPAAKYSRSDNGLYYYFIYHRIIAAIVEAGGIPVVLPTDMPENATRALYESVDGVLLPGGGDVDPKFYGAEVHPATQKPDLSRDELELNLVRWAVNDDLPLMGICRGNQVINVALGGTLVQDIPSEVETEIVHDTANVPEGRVLRVHSVRVEPDSRLAGILQGSEFKVNSLHHQSVECPAPGLTVTALSPDEVVEALEMPNKRFVVSVQWHPEDMYMDDGAMKRLFEAFIDAARERAMARAQQQNA